MKKQGSIIRWEEARGFGFIRSAASHSDVFFHVKDFRGAGADRPSAGMGVTFEEIHIGGKGPRAMAVRPMASPTQGAQRPSTKARPTRTTRLAPPPELGSGAAVALPLMLVYAAAVGWGVWATYLPWWTLAALPLLNLVAFFAYWQDKYAASKGRWRISEDTLHLWSLAGGWGGAWFAQQVLRHKSRKQAFREIYWATVVLHCGALAGWLWWNAH